MSASWFVRLFAAEIHVDAGTDVFIWRRGETRLSIAPVAFLDANEEMILAFGDAPAAPHVVVALFPANADSSDVRRRALLVKYLSYALRRIMNRPLFLRPHVVFHGTVASVLAEAMLEAGAAAVTSSPEGESCASIARV
jgi:hypothetical protein